MNAAESNAEALNHSTNAGWVDWLAIGLSAVLLIAFRLHAFDLPLEADECNYAYIGARLLAGDRMYVDLWDHQPYGVFVLFAGIIALFGDAPEVFRWMAVAFSLGSLVLVFAIVRRVAGRGAAISGAILFAAASSDPGTAGEGCNREIYMATLILAAWYFVLRRPLVSKGDTFLAGCALALASAVKTIVAVHWLFLAGWIAASVALRPARQRSRSEGEEPEVAMRNAECGMRKSGIRLRSSLFALLTSKGRQLTHSLGALTLFALGPLVLWGGSFAYFGATGRLNEFVDAVFVFNVSYSGAAESFLSRFAHFFAPQHHPFVFDSALPLWLGGIVGAVLLTVEAVARQTGGVRGKPSPPFGGRGLGKGVSIDDPPSVDSTLTPAPLLGRERGSQAASGTAVWREREAASLLLLVLSTYITVCLPAHFWPHYYYLLIPVLCVAVPAAFGRSLAWVSATSRGLSRRAGTWTAARPEGRGSDHTVPSQRSQANPVARPVGWHSAGLVLFVVFPVALLATEYRDYLSQPPFGITVKRYNSRDFWGRAQGENVRRVTDPNDAVFVFGNDPEIYYYSGRRCASRFTMITGLQSGFSGADRRRQTLMAELKEHPPRLILVLFDEKPFAEWMAFLTEYYGARVGEDLHDRHRKPIMFVYARKDHPIDSINWDWDRSQVGGWMLGEQPQYGPPPQRR